MMPSEITRGARNRLLFRWLALVALFAGGMSLAHADVYAFRDKNGVAHFSNVPNDARYRLLVVTPRAGRGSSQKPTAPSLSALAHAWLANAAPYDAVIDQAARQA